MTAASTLPGTMQLIPVPGLPMVKPGDALDALLLEALGEAGLALEEGDIVCFAQKIVSKAEGALVALSDITPRAEAIALAKETDKDPRMVELILRESTEVLRKRPGVLIVRHRLGFVGAHAGIDQSNVDHSGGELALLLPRDPDASAERLRSKFEARTGKRIGVLITDSSNRPWRLGTIGSAIGCSGLRVLDDRRTQHDIFGRELKVTLINRADAIATAAVLVMGETTERIPAVIVRGIPWDDCGQNAAMINRPLEEDLFR